MICLRDWKSIFYVVGSGQGDDRRTWWSRDAGEHRRGLALFNVDWSSTDLLKNIVGSWAHRIFATHMMLSSESKRSRHDTSITRSIRPFDSCPWPSSQKIGSSRDHISISRIYASPNLHCSSTSKRSNGWRFEWNTTRRRRIGSINCALGSHPSSSHVSVTQF